MAIDVDSLGYLLPSDTQMLSHNGKPLTGGHVRVYLAGTDTRYITYQDWDGTENPFDILIPNDGRIVVLAEITKTYDYYVYDSYGNLVFSRLNVSTNVSGDIHIEGQITSIENNDGNLEITNQLIDNVNHFQVNFSQEFIDDYATKEYVDGAIDEAIEEVTEALDDKKDKQLAVKYVGNNKRTITDLRQDENGKITFVTFSDIDYSDCKQKQNELEFNGSTTKTITGITQDEDGKINVTFDDIDIPQQVPNIEIESSSLNVESSVDPETNTKTFTIELEGSELEYYNAGKDNGTVIWLNNNSAWLPLANQYNLYGSNGITMNSDYTRANLDSNKKYLCCAEVSWDVNSYNVADTIATLSLNYQIGTNTANPFMFIEIDMSRVTRGKQYVTWLTESAPWTGVYANLFNNDNKSIGVAITHFFVIEQSAITGGSGGGGTEYTAGDAIDITNDTISVKYGQGLELDSNNSLKVKLGKGLKFDTEAGIEGEISIDDIGQEVIEEVLELSSELDKKITTTFNYAQITSAEDFAPFGVSGTTRMIGQLFAVPISSEIRENDTLICIRAKQGYAGKVSFGIFEFDFDGNEGSGSTTWLCDTGVVSIKEGENQFPLKHIIPTSTVRPVIKMEPGKLYYATVMVANDAPATGLFLASCPPYDQNYNATPKYTMVVSNMDSYVDWSIGTQRNTWFQGYNEFNNVPRLFMMIRNGEATPVPTIDPFVNYSSFTLGHQYRINDLFSLEFNVNNQPVLYQKIRPAQDCTITKIGWVDYHNGATYDYATDIPLMIDGNYTSMTTFGQNVESSSGTKIDGTHYYHEYTLSTPINLQADTNYFVPCNMKISGVTEWIITYSSPAGTSKDLILFDSKYNVASWAGNHAEYLSSQPGTLCRIVTSDNKTYTF